MATVRKRTWGDGKSAWIVDYYDNRGDRRRKHFPTKKAADAFRISIEGQMQAGIYRPDASRVALQEAAQSFLAHCDGRYRRDERMTRKMLVVYRGHVRNHIVPGLGEWRLSALTTRAIGGFRDRLRDGGVSVPTARKVLATLHSVLEYAKGQDWIAGNPAHGVRVIGPRGEGPEKIKPPSKEEFQRVLALAPPELRLMMVFAAATGVRAGEQWALRWGNVDFTRGELRVSRRVDAYGQEGPPKTAAGVRTIPLSGALLRELKAWRLRSRGELVFPNRRGGYMCHDNLIKRGFARLRPSFNWHGLRHFAVSCWIEEGLRPKTVQTFAGHASLAITMDRYGHLFPSDDHRRAMDRIARGLDI